VVAFLLSSRGFYARWFTYFTATTDVILVAFALWTSQFGQNSSLASIVTANTYGLYFVAIVFTLRRRDKWNTLYSSALSTLTYLAMVVAIGRAGLFGAILESGGRIGVLLEVNLVNETVKILSLLLTGYIGFGIVRAGERLFDKGLSAQQEVERVTSTFGRYVSADLAESILHTSIESAGEERDATIVFVDIIEFTNATERLSANELFRGLNIFVSHVIQLANEHAGFINKFIGDAVMIVFGAPIKSAEHRERAIDFARALCDRRPHINADLRSAGIEWDFSFGVGINSGSVFLGNIGNEDRAEYTAIGDAVNVAARLEKATHAQKIPRPILVGESTYSEARADLLQEVGKVSIRGKTEQVRVFQVL
jgi:adenylate cyclase